MPLRIGVLVSGRGSNLEAILKAVKKGRIRDAEVSVVISNFDGARALDIAREHGISAFVIPSKGLSRSGHERLVLERLKESGVLPGEGLVLLAGYMRVLSPEFVALFRGRMMNIHPALLPSFPGLEAQAQAISYGVKVSGCTVHFVVPEVDSGPIIVQKAVPVREGDTADSLAARILKEEHRLYPRAVELFAEGRLRIVDRRVQVLQ